MQAMVAALPYITAGASVLTGVTAIQQANYQAAVLARNSAIMEENAARTAAAAQEDMADQDRAAAAEIASLETAMSASGLDGTGGSMMLRRRGLTSLADRDRERLALKRDTEVGNMMQEAAGMRADSSAAKSAGQWGWLTTGIGALSSYLSSATMVNNYNSKRSGLFTLSHQ